MQSFGNGLVITSHILLGLWLLISGRIKINPCLKIDLWGQDYSVKPILWAMSPNKYYLTRRLFGWRLCFQPIRYQVWKSLLINRNFYMNIHSNSGSQIGAWIISLQWRHNGCDSVSNHQPHDCLLNRLFRRRSKKTSKLHVIGLCMGNSPGTGEIPAQMASYAERVSIWWRHHGCKEN